MGKVKSNVEIIAPETTIEAQPPTPDVLPPDFQPRKLEQAETPKKRETPRKREPVVVAFPPTSEPEELEEIKSPRKHEDDVVAFPPTSDPGKAEEIQNVQTVHYVATPLTPIPLLTPPIGNPWTTGLFDCIEDPTNALMTALLPCATFGQIAEVLDAGELTCPMGGLVYIMMAPAVCTSWIMGSKYRRKLRMRYGLVEAPHNDVFSHIFCPFCSLCQEFRELRNRGLDPSLGWNGILAQRQQLEAMYANQQMNNPPPTQSMSM